MNNDFLIKLKEKVTSGSFSAQELLNLKENAEKKGNAEIVDLAENQLRKQFPRIATNNFGKKEEFALDILTKINDHLESKYNLLENKHKNGPKIGGLMISGEIHVDCYISYKNDKNEVITLTIHQAEPDSEAQVILRKYTTNHGEENSDSKNYYKLDEIDQVALEYENLLKEVLT